MERLVGPSPGAAGSSEPPINAAPAIRAAFFDSDDSDEADLSVWQSKKTKPTAQVQPVQKEQSRRRTASRSVSVMVAVPGAPAPQEEDYESFLGGEDRVKKVLREVEDEEGNGAVMYEVMFDDLHTEVVAFPQLIELDNGSKALEYFDESSSSENSQHEESSNSRDQSVKMVSTRRNPKKAQRHGYIDSYSAIPLSDDELAGRDGQPSSVSAKRQRNRRHDRSPSIEMIDSESDHDTIARRSTRIKSTKQSTAGRRNTRSSGAGSYQQLRYDTGSESSESDEIPFLHSDVLPSRKRKRGLRQRGSKVQIIKDGMLYEEAPKAKREGIRQSGRTTRHQEGMQEVGEDDIWAQEESQAPAKAKAIGTRESFKDLPRNNEFRQRHMQQCDTCGNGVNYAQLIYCQGCTLAYHKSCIGQRTNREHLVTKVGEGDCVLQCRRCICAPRKKDHTAPDQSKCQDCKQTNAASVPFSEKRSMLQEHRLREENNGEDPIHNIDPQLINNAENVMFRCTSCWRGFHFEHLPSLTNVMEFDGDSAAEERFREYCREWKCRDCTTMPAKVSGIIAWKPVDEDTYDPLLTYEMTPEDEKAYLIKWEKMSYFRATWMPGPWVWGVTAGAMRKAFAKRDDSRFPKMRTEDAIPEDYLRVDIVLNVKYTSIVDVHAEEVEKARIREVDEALVKFKGLGYEDAVWEKPPTPDDDDRWTDFVVAYNDWVLGRYVHCPKAGPLKSRLERARSQDFATKLEKKKQPENLIGGELMKYQIEGLNWLYYKWYTQKNAMLADEMGLGKTIQIIAFLATLVSDWNCFPFLVIVPNSTCANWRREIKQWAPSLRVVAYFGSQAARDLAYRHELFPDGSKDLRCHIVVTSYDAAADDSCRKFFRSIMWQGLIVDEGQRLKNDKNQLYAALGALKCPFRILLTGTPLQNNARELFNLLQFLDDSFDAAALEAEYEELTTSNVPKLHELIRPFFLRRTKAQVLTFLPPVAQIIVPVSMSLVQKKLYKSILAKSPELLRAIFTAQRELKPTERGSLSNILMQLRKCLCHPFVYNMEIEEKSRDSAVSHRNLVEASAKLQLLEMLLPKLKERGHRVLIFSQFLDMLTILEDFLDGLQLRYQRLDGTINSLQKQKRIDEFNDPESQLFAFLLSTRAGGVGINLATADTVIILDPDYNPHQDIQALSRAHRIGQKKKVLCFQLMTRASVEEKIVQTGRKKMALDHVLIEQMDADEDTSLDLESILRHGAAELFNDDGTQDIKYDDGSIDKLLDRSQIENTKAGEDNSAESQFSFARVWANDVGVMQDSLAVTPEEERAPDPTVWDKILKERERAAAAEAAATQKALGRGRRARTTVDYAADREAEAGHADVADAMTTKRPRRGRYYEDEDTDFRADSDEDSGPEEADGSPVNLNELQDGKKAKATTAILGKGKFSPLTPPKTPTKATKSSVKTKPIPNKATGKKHAPLIKKQHPKGATLTKVNETLKNGAKKDPRKTLKQAAKDAATKVHGTGKTAPKKLSRTSSAKVPKGVQPPWKEVQPGTAGEVRELSPQQSPKGGMQQEAIRPLQPASEREDTKFTMDNTQPPSEAEVKTPAEATTMEPLTTLNVETSNKTVSSDASGAALPSLSSVSIEEKTVRPAANSHDKENESEYAPEAASSSDPVVHTDEKVKKPQMVTQDVASPSVSKALLPSRPNTPMDEKAVLSADSAQGQASGSAVRDVPSLSTGTALARKPAPDAQATGKGKRSAIFVSSATIRNKVTKQQDVKSAQNPVNAAAKRKAEEQAKQDNNKKPKTKLTTAKPAKELQPEAITPVSVKESTDDTEQEPTHSPGTPVPAGAAPEITRPSTPPMEENVSSQLHQEFALESSISASQEAPRGTPISPLQSPNFQRVSVPTSQLHKFRSLPTPYATPNDYIGTQMGYAPAAVPQPTCMVCQNSHRTGSCPLKLAGVEICNICGIAHFGRARECPHVQSETQVRAMLLALSYSNEPAHLVAEAKRYLQGVKGHLVQRKKILAEKNAAAAQNQNYNHNQMQMQMPQNQMPQNQNWVPQT
ncbi:hypothetical protein LTR50_001583 [Elasticomyces elasticus]|nr:hypothetical protein LTR50_001583 [Elasticomyces elasticus]